MLIRCLSAMLSFGTCNGNHGGFTVCTVKNNLGILVVVFIPKCTRFELHLYVVEATLENKCTVSVCVFKTTIMQGTEKMYHALLSSPVTSNCLEVTGRENMRLEQSGSLLAIVQMERGKQNLERKYFLPRLYVSAFFCRRL